MALKITPALKQHFVSKGWAAADVTDEKLQKQVAKRIISGEFTQAELTKLTDAAASSAPPSAAELDAAIDKKLAPMAELLKQIAEKAGVKTDPTPTPAPTPTPTPASAVTKEQVDELVKSRMAEMFPGAAGPDGTGMAGLLSRSADILGRPGARVKTAAERYAHTKTAAICPTHRRDTGAPSYHPMAGQPAVYMGNALDWPSDRDKAVAAAYFKFALSKAHAPQDIPYKLQMTEHDKDLLQYAIRESKWSGYLRSNVADDNQDPDTASTIYVGRRKLSDMEQKALLDDSVSGGIEIAPIEFDDALVTYPVLYGELFPFVNVQNVARGRRMKGGSVLNPTFTSGVAEGTPIQTFNTSGFVTAFDTTIYTAVGAMEIGLDFEEDSPTNVGGIIVQKYGEKALEWLDRVVAVGDGVTEPEGVFTSSAVTVLNSDFGTPGPATFSDLEGLMFGVPKAFRAAKGGRNCYIGNDITYRRLRAIPIGPGDERRLLGMTHGDYRILETPYRQSVFIPNNKLSYANLGFYRMYRRLGINIRIETAGQYLATKNLKLIVVRMRYGGRLELGGAATVILDGQN